ncbi:hypothetical protein EV426DRAFT_579837 [Tirmania nivea]|nr:hypothetical protein EV426DRAFT_579837 [Tirmania nivea]
MTQRNITLQNANFGASIFQRTYSFAVFHAQPVEGFRQAERNSIINSSSSSTAMHGLTLPAWAALSLYWLVTLLMHLIFIDPNPPTPTGIVQRDTQTPGKPPSTTANTPPPAPARTLHEPLLVRLATNRTFLALSRTTVITLPAVHLTLLHLLRTRAATPPTPHLDVLLCPHAPHPPLSPVPPPALLGILLVLLAAPLRLLCFHQLGASFTFALTPPRAGLVKSGLYRYVRHPSYASALLSLVGFLLAFAAPGGAAVRCFLGHGGAATALPLACLCAAMAAVLEMFRERMAGEERLLHELFGDEWCAYVARTNKLVPWVY